MKIEQKSELGFIIPPQGKRKGKIIVRAVYQKTPTSEETREKMEVIARHLQKFGLNID